MRYTYIASDNTSSDAQVLGASGQDIYVHEVIFGTPTDGKYVLFFNKRVAYTGDTSNIACKITQPTHAEGSNWVRSHKFETPLQLDGGSVHTDDSQITIIWEPVDEAI